MGAWILASVFYACFVTIQARSYFDAIGDIHIQPSPVRRTRQTDGLEVNNGIPIESDSGIHSAVSPYYNNPETSATNYQPYNVKMYGASAENERDATPYNPYNGYNEASSYETDARQNEFTSAEADVGPYNQREYMETAGYNPYRSATSFNLEGPKQVESISTQSMQKEVEPYDVSTFQKSHKEEEQHAEVHYHQHKHLHKHNHKQEHTHKHQQEHKHEHDHKHNHNAQHEHKHNAQHKHVHKAEHKHMHKAEHQHNHQQQHKHSHQAAHKHEHKHQQEHKHDHRHGHKHSHKADHKHSHHSQNKHDHRHEHKHEARHQHKHQHQADHKHNHGHKDEHKHQHYNNHKYYYQKHL